MAAAIHSIFTRKIRTEKFCSVFFLTKKNVSFIDLYIVSSSLVSFDDLLFILLEKNIAMFAMFR